MGDAMSDYYVLENNEGQDWEVVDDRTTINIFTANEMYVLLTKEDLEKMLQELQ